MEWRLALIAALAAVALSAHAAEPEGAAALRLVPFPKEVKLAEGRFALDRPLVLTGDIGKAELFAQMIGAELARVGLKPPSVDAN
jgi:hypothetical protein